MVFHEVSQKGDIFATSLHLSDSIVQIGDVARNGSERIDDQIPDRKIEETTHIILVVANTADRVVVDFADDVNSSGRFEGREKRFVQLKACVEPDPVDAVGLNSTLHPGLPFADNSGIFGIEIGQAKMIITRPTFLRVSCILIVGDLTVRVIITRVIEDIKLSVVNRGVGAVPSHVICNHVDH